MKFIYPLLLSLCLPFLTMAQVGVGTPTPDASAAFEVNSTTKGFLPPRMTQLQRDAIVSPAQGLLVYCTNCSPQGMYVNDGTPAVPVWNALSAAAAPQVMVNCALNGFAGTYVSGTAMTAGNTFSVTVTNNSFSNATISFGVGDLVLSGTTGLTVASVNPASATLNAGQAQLVTYTLSGTPATAGTLTGNWTKLSLNCSKTQTITLGASLGALTCSSGTTTGTITAGSAASGVSFSIPYTGGNGGAFAAQNISSTGVTGLTAALAAGSVATGAGSLNFTVSGTPSAAGTASFTLNIGGQNCVYSIPVMSLSSGGTAVVSAWACNTGSGNLQVGVPATGVTHNITATVTAAGSYNISIPAVNGVIFSASGTFAATGSQPVVLTASGTPTSSGTASFTLPTTPNCSFTRTILPAATFNCAAIAQTISPATPLVNNTAYTGTVTITYTAGNSTAYGATTLGPVSGLTLTRVAGTYAPGGGSVVYNLSGTYTGASNSTVLFTGFSECPSASVVFGDAIRAALLKAGCTSCAAYDAAVTDNYVQVTQAEYDSLSITVQGITNFGMKLQDRAKAPGGSAYTNYMFTNNIPTTAIPFAFSTKLDNNTAGCVKLIKQANTAGANMNVDWSTATGISIPVTGVSGSTTYYFVIKRPSITMPANTNIAVHGYWNGWGGSGAGGSGFDGVTSSTTSIPSSAASEQNCTLAVGTINTPAPAGTPPSTWYLNYDIKWTTNKQW